MVPNRTNLGRVANEWPSECVARWKQPSNGSSRPVNEWPSNGSGLEATAGHRIKRKPNIPKREPGKRRQQSIKSPCGRRFAAVCVSRFAAVCASRFAAVCVSQ